MADFSHTRILNNLRRCTRCTLTETWETIVFDDDLNVASASLTTDGSAKLPGKNKVKVTNEFIKKNNLDLYNSYAYTDHISDLDLLLMVFNPCAVNPDNLLFEEAKKRNWPVLMFNKNLINK